ncbi:MAG: hypothetical protein HY898_31270 [Deltaproteobacteria bacterium]|nr:hypothetical protein [Deltaproteobacteria bacterium]
MAPVPPHASTIAELADAPVPIDEFKRRAATPPSPEETAEILELVEWFTRRYPTVKARMDYVRRAWKQWTRPTRIIG